MNRVAAIIVALAAMGLIAFGSLALIFKEVRGVKIDQTEPATAVEIGDMSVQVGLSADLAQVGSSETPLPTGGTIRAIEASSGIEVEVLADDSPISATVEESARPYLVTEARNGVLTIRWSRPVRLAQPAKVAVGAKDLESLVLSGSSKAKVASTSAKQFSLNLTGASEAKIESKAASLDAVISGASSAVVKSSSKPEVEADCTGGSSFTLDGSAGDVEAQASGASKVAITGIAGLVSIDLSGASVASLGGAKKVAGSSSGASRLSFGKTEDVKVESSGASSIGP